MTRPGDAQNDHLPEARPIEPTVWARPVDAALPYARRPLDQYPGRWPWLWPWGNEPLMLRSLSVRDARLDLALVLLVTLLVPLGMHLLAAIYGQGVDLIAAPIQLLIAEKVFAAFTAVALAVILVLRHRMTPAALGLQLNHPIRQAGWAAGGLVTIYVYMFTMMLIIVALFMLVPGMERDVMERMRLVEVMQKLSLGSTLALLVPVAIHEEMVFRGLLIPLLRRAGMGWAPAIGLSSLLFASLHLDQGAIGALQILGVSLILSLTFVGARSLFVPMVVHFLFDLIQTQLARAVPLPNP